MLIRTSKKHPLALAKHWVEALRDFADELVQFNRPEILRAVQHLKTKRVPFVNLPEKKSQHQHAVTEEVMAQVQWLKPEQAAEIEFVERTPHGRLRHASFRRLLPRSGEK
jgi:hypothetical protein